MAIRVQKGAQKKVRKMTIHLPEELARSLKMRAAQEMTTLTAIMVRALEKELKGGKEK